MTSRRSGDIPFYFLRWHVHSLNPYWPISKMNKPIRLPISEFYTICLITAAVQTNSTISGMFISVLHDKGLWPGRFCCHLGLTQRCEDTCRNVSDTLFGSQCDPLFADKGPTKHTFPELPTLLWQNMSYYARTENYLRPTYSIKLRPTLFFHLLSSSLGYIWLNIRQCGRVDMSSRPGSTANNDDAVTHLSIGPLIMNGIWSCHPAYHSILPHPQADSPSDVTTWCDPTQAPSFFDCVKKQQGTDTFLFHALFSTKTVPSSIHRQLLYTGNSTSLESV